MTTLEYFGHSCFRLTAENGYQIIFDPYEKYSVPGIELPEDLTADLVLCSHGHEDHNATDRVTLVRTGKENPYLEQDLTIPHDDAEGAKRGMNTVRILKGDGLKIVHFGDIGRTLNFGEIEALKGADVIMIPCGGYFTIDAVQANRIIETICPKLAVLMHYRTDTSGYSLIANLKDVLSVFPNAEVLSEGKIVIGEVSGIVAMSRIA